MSELTPCNYCNLQSIKARKPEGAIVLVVNNGGWKDVYVVPAGEKIDTRQDPETGNHLSSQFQASMMEITDHCCC